MEKEKLLKELNLIFDSLDELMRRHGIKKIRLWKGTMLQEVVVNTGGSCNLVFEKRTLKEWEEKKKVR